MAQKFLELREAGECLVPLCWSVSQDRPLPSQRLFFFLGLHLWPMEVSGLVAESEQQLWHNGIGSVSGVLGHRFDPGPGTER